jgi:CRISPR-associated exonuclease Cas4
MDSYSEEDYIQLSSIQHYVFCPRQCGLIHVEGLWAENIFTTKGRLMHERVDNGEDESRGDLKIVRGLNIFSKRLGLSGRADVVEFLKDGKNTVPYPVEYKSGKPKNNISDLAQLCAQALCLEEMLNVPVTEAAVFYGKPRKRQVVELSNDLRKETEGIIETIHDMIRRSAVPTAKYEKKCDSCSLTDTCMPATTGQRKLDNYIRRLFTADEETS